MKLIICCIDKVSYTLSFEVPDLQTQNVFKILQVQNLLAYMQSNILIQSPKFMCLIKKTRKMFASLQYNMLVKCTQNDYKLAIKNVFVKKMLVKNCKLVIDNVSSHMHGTSTFPAFDRKCDYELLHIRARTSSHYS